MKKIKIFLFLLLGLGFSAAAQDENPSLFPQKGYAGIGMNVTGLINNMSLTPFSSNSGSDVIFARYFYKDNRALRFGLGPEIYQFNQLVTDSVGAAKRDRDSSFAMSVVNLDFGFEHHLFSTKRLDPYFGAELNVGFISRSRIKTALTLEDTTGTSELTTDTRMGGGFSVGMTALAGFNFFITKHLALGAEYALSYRYLQAGGDFERVIINTPVTGQSTSRREVGSNLQRSNNFLLNNRVELRLSYYFPLAKTRAT